MEEQGVIFVIAVCKKAHSRIPGQNASGVIIPLTVFWNANDVYGSGLIEVL